MLRVPIELHRMRDGRFTPCEFILEDDTYKLIYIWKPLINYAQAFREYECDQLETYKIPPYSEKRLDPNFTGLTYIKKLKIRRSIYVESEVPDFKLQNFLEEHKLELFKYIAQFINSWENYNAN